MAFSFDASTNKNYLQTINPNAPDAGSALKVLSLNLPNFLGGSPIAPDGLLRPGMSINAQVGGTPDPAPIAPAGPSPALSGLSAQLGTPDVPPPSGTPLAATPAPSSPTAASPFQASSAPLASLAGSLVGSTPAPNAAPAGPPAIEFHAPRVDPGLGDLAQLLSSLLQGDGNATPEPNDSRMI